MMDDAAAVSVRSNLVDKSVGSRIRSRRVACGVNAAELSRVLCVSEAEFDDWEEGRARPPRLNVLEIARLLDIEPASFFEGLSNGGGLLVQSSSR
jgi:transcriptional regulator with XRE-family HTH domain